MPGAPGSGNDGRQKIERSAGGNRKDANYQKQQTHQITRLTHLHLSLPAMKRPGQIQLEDQKYATEHLPYPPEGPCIFRCERR